MLELYHPGSSFLHKLPPGIKLLTLAACGTVLFLVEGIPVILGFFTVTVALFPLCQMPLRTAWQQVRPALWILIILCVAQLLINGWALAIFATFRLATLLMMAGLLTLTTRSSDMILSLIHI